MCVGEIFSFSPVHTHIYIHIWSKKVKLVTFVEGDPKALFSVATTARCRGATPSPGLLHFNLDPFFIVLRAKQGVIK